MHSPSNIVANFTAFDVEYGIKARLCRNTDQHRSDRNVVETISLITNENLYPLITGHGL
jgi:hypothetical protein